MTYKKLNQGVHYIVIKQRNYSKYSTDLEHICIEYKGDNCCLLRTYHPNNPNNEYSKEWIQYSKSNFLELIEELRGFDREENIDKVLG